MKAAFLGTPAAAIPALAALAGLAEVDLVVTRPDAASGRSKRLKAPPVKVAAAEFGLEVAQPATGEQLRSTLDGRNLDIAVVVAYGRLLDRATLDTTRVGFVNLHFSILPRWRGAAPVERAILAGDEVTGVSLMQIDEGLDTGPVIAVAETDIGTGESAGQLTQRLSFLGAALLDGSLREFLSGARRPAPQFEAGASRAPRLTSAEAVVDPGDAVDQVLRKIRAYNPRPGATIVGVRTRLKVWEASPAMTEVLPGFLSADEGVPILGVGDGAISLNIVQPAGRSRMTGSAWLRGLSDASLPLAVQDL